MQLVLSPVALSVSGWSNINDGKKLLTEIGFSVTMPPVNGEAISGSLNSRNTPEYMAVYLEFTDNVPWNFAPNAGSSTMDKDRFTWTNN
jgi:hypothetical protein